MTLTYPVITMASGRRLSDLVVFPNPFTSEIRILFSGEEAVSGQPFNALGEMVKSFADLRNGEILRLEPLPEGSYFLRTITPVGQQTVRLIKTK